MKFTGSLKNIFLHYYTKISNETLIYLLSFGLGIVAGIAAIVLKYSVHFIRNLLEFGFTKEYANILYLVYPTVGILITLLFIKYILRRKIGDGIPGLLFAISQNGGIIKKYHMFSSIVASAFTVGFGGSVGLEGPTVATGG
ncbi:MAG TPA: chloride channel protein, partial [Bacteroidales bacterium]|nr:chloride channel protein [Bacteroidales bacterium]